MTIPSQIEQDVISGKAVYRTAQFGSGGQNILPVGNNQSIVIFGYVYCPAGNGAVFSQPMGPDLFDLMPPNSARKWMSQQILFYTESDFFPFVENVKMISSINHIGSVAGGAYYGTHAVSADPILRSCYIPANNDVSISVMLLEAASVGFGGQIPITSTTPQYLSYGGWPQNTAVQTDLGSWPDQFLQPKVQGWDRPPYSYGLIPNNAQEQYWQALVDPNPAGPYEPAFQVMNLYGEAGPPADGSFYKLTLHYALYNNPEK